MPINSVPKGSVIVVKQRNDFRHYRRLRDIP